MPSPVVFGYQTALQIARIANNVRLLDDLPTSSRTIPARAPEHEQILAAVKMLRDTYPDLHLTAPLHVLVGSNSLPLASPLMKPHSCTRELPRESLVEVAESVFITVPPLSVIHESTRRHPIDFIESCYELCGRYQSMRFGLETRYDIPALTSVNALRAYAERNGGIRGARKTLQALSYVADESASTREAKLVLVLGLPTIKGGFGLGIPCLNFEIETSPAARAITGKHMFRCDLYYPSKGVAIEYESDEFHDGEDKRGHDSRRTAALMSMNRTVFCVTNEELDSYIATDVIGQSVRRQLGKRQRTKLSDYHARKIKLRISLGLPIGYD